MNQPGEYIYPLFFGFPSHLGPHRALSSLCYTLGSHLICLTQSSVYTPIPIFQFISSLLPSIGLFSMSVSLSAFQIDSSVPFSRVCIYALMCDICFSPSDLLHSVTTSRSIHLSANGRILFLFMPESYSIVYMCHGHLLAM